MLHLFKRWLLCWTLFYPSVAANASNSNPGVVGGVTVQENARAFFSQAGARTARPACATIDRWAFSLANPSGQGMLAAILTAYSLGRPVSVVGTGTCDVWPDTETVVYIFMP